MNKKSIAGAVLGIIGAALLIVGSVILGVCAQFVDAVASETNTPTYFSVIVYVLGLGGAAVAMVGAGLDFKHCYIGGALQFVGLVLALVMSILVGFTVWNIIAMILLLIGGILSFAVKKPIQG